jgi:hypothetical protein
MGHVMLDFWLDVGVEGVLILLKDLEMYGKEYAIQSCFLYGRGDFEYLAKP